MKSKYQYIKEAILNPLLIMENIMGSPFPNKEYVYLNTIYFTFIKALQLNIPYETYEIIIDKILEHHGITDDVLEKLDKQHKKLDGFMSIIHEIRIDLLKSYAQMGMRVVTGSDEEDAVLEYRKLIDAMYLDPENIIVEFEAHQILFERPTMMDLSVWIHESMHTLLFNMLHHDDKTKAGRIYVYTGENNEYDQEGMIPDGKTRRRFIQVFNREFAVHDKAIKSNIKMDVRRKEREKKEEAEREERREIRNDKKKNKTDLPKQVNTIDKESGCNLKHPEKTVDTQYEFEVKVNKYKYALAKYLFKLNQMKLKKHIKNNTIFGMEVQNIELNKKFKKASPWFDKEEVETSDPKYMIRFISHIFAWTIRHLNDVAEICYAFNKDGEHIEYESKMEYVKYTVKRAVALADRIIRGESVEDDLMYFEELMMYMESSPKTKKRVKKNVKNFHRAVATTCLDAKPFPAIAMYPPNIQMDTMVKLAYMVTTHDKKMRADLPFHEKYKFNKTKETKVILQELGRAIHKTHKKLDTPPMFKYFVYSDPIIESQFRDVNENQELATGVVAMKYLAFLINDENVTKRIDGII